jgi:hypothetical protein
MSVYLFIIDFHAKQMEIRVTLAPSDGSRQHLGVHAHYAAIERELVLI